jgi:hypothetical protein
MRGTKTSKGESEAHLCEGILHRTERETGTAQKKEVALDRESDRLVTTIPMTVQHQYLQISLQVLPEKNFSADLNVPPSARSLLPGKNPFAEPEILTVSAVLMNHAVGLIVITSPSFRMPMVCSVL